MMKEDCYGTMTFPSPSAVALWTNELSGQLSDGMWENARPLDHWKFWCRLYVGVGPAKIVTENRHACRKSSYNFNALIELVGDRMLATGRFAKAGADPTDRQMLHAAEYLPETLEGYRECLTTDKWPVSFPDTLAALKAIPLDLVIAYYETEYTLKDLKADLKLIKSVMKQADPR